MIHGRKLLCESFKITILQFPAVLINGGGSDTLYIVEMERKEMGLNPPALKVASDFVQSKP